MAHTRRLTLFDTRDAATKHRVYHRQGRLAQSRSLPGQCWSRNGIFLGAARRFRDISYTDKGKGYNVIEIPYGTLGEEQLLWGKKKPEPPKRAAKAAAPPEEKMAQRGTARRPAWATAADISEIPTLQELPELLLAHANVKREQMLRALETQRETGDFIGEILVKQGVLDDNSLVAFLAKYCKIPHLSLLDYVIDTKLLELVPFDLCQRHRLIPVDKMGRNLTVAMVNPLDSRALEALRTSYPDLRIKPILCTAKHFRSVSERLFKRHFGNANLPEETGAAAKGKSSTVAGPEAMLLAGDLPEVDAAYWAIDQEEIPFAVAYQGPVDEKGRPIVTDEHREALFDGVFSSCDDVSDEPGGEASPANRAAIEKMTLDMTSAMVQSMHNTYQVLERRVRFFHGVAPEAIAKLFSRGKTVEYEAGQVIFQKGESGRCMFVILNGAVEIVDEGRHLALLGKGEIFGEIALVSNAARSASAKTVSETSLLMLSFDDITKDLDNTTSSQILVNIIMTLSSRLVKMQSG